MVRWEPFASIGTTCELGVVANRQTEGYWEVMSTRTQHCQPTTDNEVWIQTMQPEAPVRWSFHTHSSFCDGEGSLEEMVEAALGAGLTDLGFSSHAPLPFDTDWNMALSRLDEYVAQAHRLRERYADRIRLWLGAELDYIPAEQIASFQAAQVSSKVFDYFVGSVHFLGDPRLRLSFDGTKEQFDALLADSYGGEIRSMVEDYYTRIASVPSMPGVLIVGHFDVIKRWNADKQYFTGDEPWYRDAADAALSAIAGSGVLLELNTAGWRKDLGEPYPATWVLERCRDLGIRVTISADAHAPSQLTWGYDRAIARLSTLGIRPVNPAQFLGVDKASS